MGEVVFLKDRMPKASIENLVFWFVQNSKGTFSGYSRADILKVLDKLYRNRSLFRDHLLIIRHYGRKGVSPDCAKEKEKRAFKIWGEAIELISREVRGITK